MRAVRFHKFGGPDELVLEDVPDRRPRFGEVRVDVHAAGVNPKDVFVRKGRFKAVLGQGFPKRLGHDFAGVVESVGRGVKRVRVGDEVYGMIPGYRVGAYAERVIASVDWLALKPTHATMVQAAGVPLAAMTALQALADLHRVEPGERVLINGASGGVGIFAVQLTRLLGAIPVAVCSAKNEAFVRELGAADVLPYDRRPLSELGLRFDHYFDVFGNTGFAASRAFLAPHGVYVTTIPRRDTMMLELGGRMVPRALRKGPTGRLVMVHPRPRELSRLACWIDRGELDPVVDRVYPLADVRDAHRYVETKRARGKVVLEVV
ncbi:MAG: NADP-dependent oxidoreductase [Sandaracinaceae bacterium]